MKRPSVVPAVLIMVGTTFVLVGAVFALQLSRPASASPQVVPVVADLHGAWVQAVRTELSSLDSASSLERIKAARESLLNLRVASADRDSHLALVMALLAWERGEAGAFAELQTELNRL